MLVQFYVILTLQKEYRQVSGNTKPNQNKNIFKMAYIHKLEHCHSDLIYKFMLYCNSTLKSVILKCELCMLHTVNFT